MGYPIKQSQTAQPLLFLMVDSADHITGKTGLTPTVTLSKSGGAFASPAGAVTEIANGWYQVAGNATDSGTLGPLLLHATSTGADPTDDRFDVVAYDPQNGTSLGLTLVPANTTQFGGHAVVLDANNYPGVNIVDVAGAAASAVSGAIDANMTSVNGTTFTGANVPADLQTIKTQTVTCAAGVTISPFVGNDSAALQVDTSGYVKVSEGTGQGQIILNLGYVTASTVVGAVQGDVYGDVRGKVLGTATAGTIVGAGAWALDGTGGAIPTAAQNAAVVLATPANLLATDANGRVVLQPTQTGVTIPTVTTVTNAVTAGTVSDKTGYALASTGLDAIAVTAPTTVATTFPQMVVQTWRRFFKKAVLTGGLLKTYADDGTTIVTTQTSTDVTTSETQGAAT